MVSKENASFRLVVHRYVCFQPVPWSCCGRTDQFAYRLATRRVGNLNSPNNDDDADVVDSRTQGISVNGLDAVGLRVCLESTEVLMHILLGGSSCMVKITPNAPNLDHAKQYFFTGTVLRKKNIRQKKVSFLPFVPFCAFFQTAENKKKL